MSFFLCRGERQSGPHTLAELRALVLERRISSSDLLWRDGWEDWRSVAEVPGVLTPGLPPKAKADAAANAASTGDSPVTSEPENKELVGQPALPSVPDSVSSDEAQAASSIKENTANTSPNPQAESTAQKRAEPHASETDNFGWQLFKPHGRIGRVRWAVRSTIFTIASAIPQLGLVFLFLFFVSAVKRLHDFKFRGWWLLVLLPVAAILSTLLVGTPANPIQCMVGLLLSIAVLLAFIPGTRGENQFGLPEQRRPRDQETR